MRRAGALMVRSLLFRIPGLLSRPEQPAAT